MPLLRLEIVKSMSFYFVMFCSVKSDNLVGQYETRTIVPFSAMFALVSVPIFSLVAVPLMANDPEEEDGKFPSAITVAVSYTHLTLPTKA